MSTYIYDNGGLSESEQSAGQSAARDIFSAHGRTAEYCYAQSLLSAAGDDFDAPALQTWYDAENSAISAAFHAWDVIPQSASMALA